MPDNAPRTAPWLLISGALCFALSLYARVLSGWAPLVALTPAGGAIMLAGWTVFVWQLWVER